MTHDSKTRHQWVRQGQFGFLNSKAVKRTRRCACGREEFSIRQPFGSWSPWRKAK